MTKSFRLFDINLRRAAVLVVTVLAAGFLVKGWLGYAQPREATSLKPAAQLTAPVKPPAANAAAAAASDPTLEGFRHVEVASIADAIEQLYNKKMYMSHKMHALFPTRFAGYALTMLLKKQENTQGSASMNGELHAIDEGAPESVYVAKIEDGADIGAMGGLMGTAMAARDFAGAVLDGGVRDTAYLRKIAFPVYSLGEVPSTSVNHYVFGGANIPIVCDGVPVKPHDIIVADSDGVVVVPQEHAAEILALSQKLDFQEHSMYPLIEREKSIEAAVQKFGRI